MKIPRLAFVAALLTTLATQSFAETCGDICTPEFWETATPQTIETAIKKVDVNTKNYWDETALHHAANLGTPENIKALLNAGADVNAPNKDGSTPLHYAVTVGLPDNTKALLKAGANVNASNSFFWTPLHWAAEGGTPENIKVLLEAGADGTAKNKDGDTPWDLAQLNEKLKDTDAYWKLKDANFQSDHIELNIIGAAVMIDTKFNVRRYIAEYSEETQELIAEYDLALFELSQFQKEFNEPNGNDPMFDCYPIKLENTRFLKGYIIDEPKWDFVKKSYFVEAHGI